MPTTKDYWPEILKLTNEKGEIQAPEGKTLDQYLAKELGLSKPTVIELLSKWEKEEKIRLERGGLTRKLMTLQVIPKKETFPLVKEVRESQVAILIDWENLLQSQESLGLEKSPISQIFLKLIKKISRETGKILSIFIFAPPHLASVWGEDFWKQRFFVISCPKIKDKKGEERDTVDEILMDFGKKMIQNMNLTHLCIGTGDRDFSPLYQEAINQGLKIITVAASEKSLSSGLIELSDQIIILSQLEKEQE